MRRLALFGALTALLNLTLALESCTGTLVSFGGSNSRHESGVKTVSGAASVRAIAERLGVLDKLELEDVEELSGLDEFGNDVEFLGRGERRGGVVVTVSGGEGIALSRSSYCVPEGVDISSLIDTTIHLSTPSELADFNPDTLPISSIHDDTTHYISLDLSKLDRTSEHQSVQASLLSKLDILLDNPNLIFLSASNGAPSVRASVESVKEDSRQALKARDAPTEVPLSRVAVDESSDAKPTATTPAKLHFRRCYTSKDVCESSTNSCSGHGKCVNSFVAGYENGKCFHCACEATGDMEKGKTYWAGTACQKRDISVPFNIFLGLGIILIVLLGSAVGLLYGMGNEELPPVLSAGAVSAKKN